MYDILMQDIDGVGRGRAGCSMCEKGYMATLAGLDSDPRYSFSYLSADSNSHCQQFALEKPHSHAQKLGLTQLPL